MQTSLMSILTPALAGAPATRIGTAMGLQLMLMQWDYGSLFWLGLFTLFAIICLLPMVCEERERRSTRHRTARYPPPYWERRSRYQAPRILEDADRPSSPVGGTCLACGAIIREELSSRCPVCGAERQRCPICQRFVAGGQELLACPYCGILGHANEIRRWVAKRGRCPYCGREVRVEQLQMPRLLSFRRRGHLAPP